MTWIGGRCCGPCWPGRSWSAARACWAGAIPPVPEDTVNVLPGQTVTCDFDTDNPGQWMTHCHNVYHEQSGMMGIIGYVT